MKKIIKQIEDLRNLPTDLQKSFNKSIKFKETDDFNEWLFRNLVELMDKSKKGNAQILNAEYVAQQVNQFPMYVIRKIKNPLMKLFNKETRFHEFLYKFIDKYILDLEQLLLLI